LYKNSFQRDISVMHIDGECATKEVVLAGMKEYSWIHLASHGKQDQNISTKSAFLLHNRNTELTDIINQNIKDADFAFLCLMIWVPYIHIGL
ncbi:hypothetical protein BDQ17DRAFT_1258001, partial [Cyathus striatus]